MAEIWGAALGGLVAGGASLYGSSKGSKASQGAANASLAEQQREYDTTRSDNQTALDARNNGLAQMTNLAGQYKSAPSNEDVMNTPGYKFGMDQGTSALQGSAAAGGGLYSGATMRALQQYGNDYGTTKFDDAFNRLQTSQNSQFNHYASLAGAGQVGASEIGAAGMNAANNSSAINMSNGRTQAGFGVANGNAWGSAFSGLGSSLQNGGAKQIAGWFSSPSDSDYSHEGNDIPKNMQTVAPSALNLSSALSPLCAPAARDR